MVLITVPSQQAETERRAATGNPPPGTASGPVGRKKPRVETKEELKARLAEWREKLREKREGKPTSEQTPALTTAQTAFGVPAQTAAASPVVYGDAQNLAAPPATTYAGVPGSVPVPGAGVAAPAATQIPGPAGTIPPSSTAAAAAAAEPTAAPKSKKDKSKNVRLVYSDQEVSPEEKMAMLARYVECVPVERRAGITGRREGEGGMVAAASG
ncbi:hypothetical protein KEM56_000670 [Ascosphaera pollenicola]|nr:hypothetical protein KEM56_000670 [Ascosphaera pollenicola]